MSCETRSDGMYCACLTSYVVIRKWRVGRPRCGSLKKPCFRGREAPSFPSPGSIISPNPPIPEQLVTKLRQFFFTFFYPLYLSLLFFLPVLLRHRDEQQTSLSC